jgi:hypothetical protein
MTHFKRLRTGRIGRRGVTLVELSITTSLLTLILGGCLALALQAVRMYQNVASADWASFDAATAVATLEEDITDCFRVSGHYADRITITRPLTIWDSMAGCHVPAQPLAEGASVRYYLADAAGAMGTEGPYLWRAVRPAGGPTYVRDGQPLADNIDTLQFTYEMMAAPRQASAQYVTLLMRAYVKEGGTVSRRSHTSRITLRNAGYGPVTNETGADEKE